MQKDDFLSKLEADDNPKLRKMREMREAKLKAQGKSVEAPKQVVPAPVLFPDLLWVWSAFCYLSDRRGVGPNGPVPITMEAMSHYSKLTNRRGEFDVEQLMHFIPVLDREYLRDFYDKQNKQLEEQRKKSEQQARRGGTPSRGLNRMR